MHWPRGQKIKGQSHRVTKTVMAHGCWWPWPVLRILLCCASCTDAISNSLLDNGIIASPWRLADGLAKVVEMLEILKCYIGRRLWRTERSLEMLRRWFKYRRDIGAKQPNDKLLQHWPAVSSHGARQVLHLTQSNCWHTTKINNTNKKKPALKRVQRPMPAVFVPRDLDLWPALVAEWLTHSAAMCSRAWRAQWTGFDSAQVRPPTNELFLIIPTHMMNREIIPGRKKGSTVSSINCDRCRHLDVAVSSLPAAPAWVEVNRLGWALVGVIHSASQG